MARLVGIDIQSSCVRVAVLRPQYRGWRLLSVRQTPIAPGTALEDAVRHAVLPVLMPGDHVLTSLPGEQLFLRELKIPAAASKQLGDVVAYEIEALVPVGVDELVYDFRSAPTVVGGQLDVLAVAARTVGVRERVELLERALGSEPEQISPGPLTLANLAKVCPELAAHEASVGLLDLSEQSSDLVVLSGGRPVFARTLSAGIESLSRGSRALVAALKQSLAALSQQREGGVAMLFITSAAQEVVGMAAGLTEALGVPVSPLPPLRFAEGSESETLRYERAIACALGQGSLNLRRGSLEYQHGYEFLRNKWPLLAGLGGLVAASFAFSVWAKSRSLSLEHETLTEALSQASERLLGKPVADSEELTDLLGREKSPAEKDPELVLDAFDVLVRFTDAIDSKVVHDIEEFDFQRSKVSVRGIVNATDEAEAIADAVNKNACFKAAKISTISRVMGTERQRYELAFDVDCAPQAAAQVKGTER